MLKHLIFITSIFLFGYLQYLDCELKNVERNDLLRTIQQNKNNLNLLSNDPKNSKYILNYQKRDDDKYNYVVVGQYEDKYDPPTYVNLADTGISLPLGSGKIYKEIKTVFTYNDIRLENVSMQNCRKHIYNESNYSRKYMEHTEATRYLLDKYGFDLRNIYISSNMVSITEYNDRFIDGMYIYGKKLPNGIFLAEKISDDLNKLVFDILPDPIIYMLVEFVLVPIYIFSVLCN